MAKPFSDEEVKALEKSEPPKLALKKAKKLANAIEFLIARFLATIAADRQQIENLKLDLHIANRALGIDPATVDLRKRIAELEEYSKNKENRFHRCSGRGDAILPWHQIVCSLCLPNSPDSNFDPVKRIAELEKQAEIKDTLAEGVMTLAEVYEQLEDAKARIVELEKYKKATLSVGIKVVEICMGCGKENCGNCPAGVTYTVRNVRAVELEAENQRPRDLLLEIKDAYYESTSQDFEFNWVDYIERLEQTLRPKGEE